MNAHGFGCDDQLFQEFGHPFGIVFRFDHRKPTKFGTGTTHDPAFNLAGIHFHATIDTINRRFRQEQRDISLQDIRQ